MNILFDGRILTHKIFTGVENYAKNIYENIKETYNINNAKSETSNKYLAHLWMHFILPFKSGNILFCPANVAPLFVPKSKKLVLTIHDVAFLTYPKSFSNFFRIYYKVIVPINIKRADKIITVSNNSKKEIEKYYPKSKGKVEVISLGLDKKFKELNLQKKNQIIYVGSMNERKNFISVIKSFELLNNNDYNLLMIGNFSNNFRLEVESENILKKAKKKQNIRFIQAISNDELIKHYNESKLFIFPSFYEGFGLPVLEAMACGTPVICSNTTSLPEVGGDAVIYCNPYDVNDMKEKIELILNNESLQKEMIKKGLDRAKLFSWEKSANEHIRVFQKVLRK